MVRQTECTWNFPWTDPIPYLIDYMFRFHWSGIHLRYSTITFHFLHHSSRSVSIRNLLIHHEVDIIREFKISENFTRKLEIATRPQAIRHNSIGILFLDIDMSVGYSHAFLKQLFLMVELLKKNIHKVCITWTIWFVHSLWQTFRLRYLKQKMPPTVWN